VVVGVFRARPSRYGAPRANAAAFAAAGVQLVSVLASGSLHVAMLAASIGLGALWLVLQRRHVASLLLSCGALLNLVVVVANGGMPVDPSALAMVGRRGVDVTSGFLYKHVALTADTRFAVLADRIPVPVQRNVVSLGDLLMAIAIALWIADAVGGWVCGRRSARSMDGEHGRRPRSKRIGFDETSNAGEHGVGRLSSSETTVDLDREVGSRSRWQRAGSGDQGVASLLGQEGRPAGNTDIRWHARTA
jgi:hypothetical protein